MDRIAIIERGMDGTSVYLIRVSFLEKNEEQELELCDDPDVKLFVLLLIIFMMKDRDGGLQEKLASLL